MSHIQLLKSTYRPIKKYQYLIAMYVGLYEMMMRFLHQLGIVFHGVFSVMNVEL